MARRITVAGMLFGLSALVLVSAPAAADPTSPSSTTSTSSSTTASTALEVTTTVTTTIEVTSTTVGASSSTSDPGVGGAAPGVRPGGDVGPVKVAQRQVGPQLPPPPPTTTTTRPPSGYGVPPNSGSGRRVIYANRAQRVWVVEADGSLIRSYLVSGKIGEPRPGTYTVWSKSRHTFAVHNPSITWEYMVRFAHTRSGGNIGFHAIPVQYGKPLQGEGQLGLPLSSGCVRQGRADAVFMWNWAYIGTKVVVLP